MDASNVKVTETRSGGLEIFVSDPETDTLAIFRVRSSRYEEAPWFEARTVLRGNWAMHADEPQRAALLRWAPRLDEADQEARKIAAKATGRALRLSTTSDGPDEVTD